MRHLYIIGNGFDLAHKLDTGYGHFIIWYLNKILKYIFDNQKSVIDYEDKLMSINREKLYNSDSPLFTIEKVSDFKVRIDEFNSHSHGLKVEKSKLLEEIINKDGWADIEKEYYKFLVKGIEDSVFVKDLNVSFDTLKVEFEKYITKKILPKIDSKPIVKALYDIFSYESKNGSNEPIAEDQLFLNFNYTNTFEKKYWSSINTNKQIINIHGSVDNPENPIIFGYGDEMDLKFEEIENKDDNEYLKNMKSFGYFHTNNYKKVLKFMNNKDGDFKVHIIGHSMGLSDRLLLNTIFEHRNCKSVEIHYHKINEEKNNFYELARNMSRHFNLKMKGAMREKVVPYLTTRPMN